MSLTHIGVLVSGSGSNLQAIIDRCADGYIPARVAVVISNRPGVFALQRAERAGIPALVIDHKAHPTREAFELELVGALRSHRVEVVALAGFMRVLTGTFLREFPQRVLNIHPALLPSFPGLHVQQQALDHGVRFSGCTVHFVDEGTDTGPIVVQAVVPVLADDTADALAARILAQEHRIYPHALKLLCEGRLRIDCRQVAVEGPGPDPETALANPPIGG